MALTPGTRIGSYEIAAQIGVGGMGEVYRGIQPLWAPDQKAIHFNTLGAADGGPEMRATVETGSTFTRGPVERLFGWVPAPERIGDRKELMPDGEHFLIAAGAGGNGNLPGETDERSRIVTVYNWFEELKRLVPTE